ncbi:MAG TPA: aldo/keto reductase [Chloroflexota bacterium]|nr:aldo/keto reductase [Chloroflexota bacterium]
MDYRLLGRTGVKVARLTLGCMMFGRRTGQEETCAIVDRALDAGLNFLDTANVYNQGRSEEFTGEALRRNGKRAKIILATKVHGMVDESDPNGGGTSRRHIIEQCEASLKRLQTDWIDLYQLHRPCPEIAIDETLRALDDLVRAGKVRYLGTSNHAAWQVVDALWASKELGLNRFVCEQPPYNLLDRRVERELLPMCQSHGIGTIPWGPLGGGLLTGKYRRDEPLPSGTRYGDAAPGSNLSRHVTDRVFDIAETVSALAAEKGCTPSQLALAWVMQRPGVTAPIIGPRTMEQLEDNLGAMDVRITPEDGARLDEVAPPGTHVSPYYENWGPSLYRW